MVLLFNPLISIITPCYNGEKFVARLLESIYNQTYKKIEFIFINDGSKDMTEELVLSYKKKFAKRGMKFIYIYQENKGLGGAVNTGLKKITGEFFTWVDSDNYFDTTYLQKCVNYIEKHRECKILRCDAYTVLEEDTNNIINRFSDGNTEKFKRDLFDNAIFNKNFHFGCALLKTGAFDLIKPNREIYESRQGQNWQLLLPMFYNYKADYIDEPLFYYVRRKESVSMITKQQSIEKQIAQINEYEKIINETLKEMDGNFDSYKNAITIKYLNKKYNLAVHEGNRTFINKYYYQLKTKGCLGFKDKIKYIVAQNKALFKVAKWILEKKRRLVH